MDERTERKIITFSKDKLVQTIFDLQKELSQSNSDRQFDFLISGAGSLLFSGNNAEIVNTLDVDMHFWFVREAFFDKKRRSETFKLVFWQIFENLWTMIKRYSYMYVLYLKNLYKPKPMAKTYAGYRNHENILEGFILVDVPEITVGSIRFLGHELLDLGLHDKPERSHYYQVPVTIRMNSYLLNVTTPNDLLFNHIQILQYTREPMVPYMKVEEIYNFNGFIDQKPEYLQYTLFTPPNNFLVLLDNKTELAHNVDIINRWTYFVYDYFLYWNKKYFDDPLLQQNYSSTDLKAHSSRFSDEFIATFYFFDQIKQSFKNQQSGKLLNDKGRVSKTLRRLFVIFYFFLIGNSPGCPVALKYRPNRSACNTRLLSNCFDKTDYNLQGECLPSFGPGTHDPTPILRLERNLQAKVPPVNEPPCAPRRLYTNNKNSTQPLFNQLNDTQVLCVWSTDSTTFSDDLRDLYFTNLMGLPKPQVSLAVNFGERLLEIMSKSVLDEDITVYRGTVNRIYENGKTDYDLKVGDTFSQYAFTAVTYDPNTQNFPHFSISLLETAIYKIRLRRGTHYAYLGVDPQRTAYVNEKEMLLPPDALMTVTNISHEYVTGAADANGNTFMYKYTIYSIDYDDSPVFNKAYITKPQITYETVYQQPTYQQPVYQQPAYQQYSVPTQTGSIVYTAPSQPIQVGFLGSGYVEPVKTTTVPISLQSVPLSLQSGNFMGYAKSVPLNIPYSMHMSETDDSQAFSNTFIQAVIDNIYNKKVLTSIFDYTVSIAQSLFINLWDLLSKLIDVLYSVDWAKHIKWLFITVVKGIAFLVWKVATLARVAAETIEKAAKGANDISY
jgi:hypothetical protein